MPSEHKRAVQQAPNSACASSRSGRCVACHAVAAFNSGKLWPTKPVNCTPSAAPLLVCSGCREIRELLDAAPEKVLYFQMLPFRPPADATPTGELRRCDAALRRCCLFGT